MSKPNKIERQKRDKPIQRQYGFAFASLICTISKPFSVFTSMVLKEANREANQKLIDKDTQLAIKEKEMIKQKEATGFLYSYAYKMENEGVFKRAWKKISGKKKLLPDPSEGYQLDEVVDDLPKLE